MSGKIRKLSFPSFFLGVLTLLVPSTSHAEFLSDLGIAPPVGFIGEINYQGQNNNKFMIMNISNSDWDLTSLTIDLNDGVTFFNSSAASAGSLTTSHSSYDLGSGVTWTPGFAAGNWTAINDNGDTLNATIGGGAINFGTQVTGQNKVTFDFTGFDWFSGPISGATTAQYDAWGFNTLFSNNGGTSALTGGTSLNGTIITATFKNATNGTEMVSTTIFKNGNGASIPFAATPSAVPEPSALILLAAGSCVAGAAGIRRRFQSK